MMREYWSNVENEDGRAVLGCDWETRDEAVRSDGDPPRSSYRIHVRLKPEGAPKRYASEANRRAWELMPGRARQGAELGCVVCYSGPAEDADFWARYD